MKRSVENFTDSIFPAKNLSKSANHSQCSDYHGLEHALKRVKISVSPGQLRLENDLQSLLLNHAWTDYQDEAIDSEHSDDNLNSSSSSSQPFKYLKSPTCLQELQRDITDPLRFNLTIWLSSTTMSNISYSMKWVYHIHIPRMYPHSPPIVHRIIKSVGDGQGMELYRLTSDLSNESLSECWNSTKTDFFDLHGHRVSVDVANRALQPNVTMWVSEALDKPYLEYLQREKALMLTAVLVSSQGYSPNSYKNFVPKSLEEGRESDQDEKRSYLLYYKSPYHNMAAFQEWLPIMQLSDYIALLVQVSCEWEQAIKDK